MARQLTQDQIIKFLQERIEHVLERPLMYAGKDDKVLYGLLLGHTDALNIARFGYRGFLLDIPMPDGSEDYRKRLLEFVGTWVRGERLYE